MKSTKITDFMVKLGERKTKAGAVLEAPASVTPQELAVMFPHDTADDCIRIPLHSRKYPNLFALVDPEDADLVNQYQWNVAEDRSGRLRARARYGSPRVAMHRLIAGVTDPSILVDHVDGDTLNNRRKNLRECNNAQNQLNAIKRRRPSTSRFIGVYHRSDSGRWRAYAGGVGTGTRVDLGTFETEEEAACAYDQYWRNHPDAAFVTFNFPEGDERSACRDAEAA